MINNNVMKNGSYSAEYLEAYKNFVEALKEKVDVEWEQLKKDCGYKVQVGAFSKKENADALLARLKKAGFEGYIKYE